MYGSVRDEALTREIYVYIYKRTITLPGRQLKRNVLPVVRNHNIIQESISIPAEDRKMGKTSHGNATTRTSSRLLVPGMGWPIDDADGPGGIRTVFQG
jgi:hypothetical protein